MASRVTYGRAEQGLLPSVLGQVLPNRRTPGAAIVVTTAAVLVLSSTGDLASLAETVVVLLLAIGLALYAVQRFASRRGSDSQGTDQRPTVGG
ncbi:APC family permease [Arthrobacter sp. CAN_C5]|uniref:APC family permease n=1 Tax=Arthrobacter sp. CAN_C5 TaxID=2760706 RepID=UPI001AE96519|nr:APC family permease [Arthrobacter sp. CAN_C5]MBP2216817.1 amino acid transporter [Arthrobacter sp. CAN_C5]